MTATKRLFFVLVATCSLLVLFAGPAGIPSTQAAAADNGIGGINAIASGLAHTCTLSADGVIQCWGDNSYGQLGNGTHKDSRAPLETQGILAGVQSIASGGYHTCALTAAGGVMCWGSNIKGQLGNNAAFESVVPVEVQGLTRGVKAIAAGGSHTCALLADGTVKCWGDNSYGQLGNGTKANSAAPVAVRNLDGVMALTAGSGHTCAIAQSGVWCWGNNIMGQLGDGTTFDRNLPVKIEGLNRVSMLSAGGMHTCALQESGVVRCWGFNGHGQLGTGTDMDSMTPAAVEGLGPALAVSAGGVHTCAAMTTGEVYCWGFNRKGELGNGDYADHARPVRVTDLERVNAISAGGSHTCVLTVTGVRCWGQNFYYQLGDGTAEISNTPVDIR